jgi:hypothetical protein
MATSTPKFQRFAKAKKNQPTKDESAVIVVRIVARGVKGNIKRETVIAAGKVSVVHAAIEAALFPE